MPEIITATLASVTAAVKLIEVTAKIHGAQDQIKDLCTQIALVRGDYVEARRLLDASSPYLDPGTRSYTENAVQNFENTLAEVTKEVERATLDLKRRRSGRIRLDRKLLWVLRGRSKAMSKYNGVQDCAGRVRTCMGVMQTALIHNQQHPADGQVGGVRNPNFSRLLEAPDDITLTSITSVNDNPRGGYQVFPPTYDAASQGDDRIYPDTPPSSRKRSIISQPTGDSRRSRFDRGQISGTVSPLSGKSADISSHLYGTTTGFSGR